VSGVQRKHSLYYEIGTGTPRLLQEGELSYIIRLWFLNFLNLLLSLTHPRVQYKYLLSIIALERSERLIFDQRRSREPKRN